MSHVNFTDIGQMIAVNHTSPKNNTFKQVKISMKKNMKIEISQPRRVKVLGLDDKITIKNHID